MSKRNISYIKPEDPKFLRLLKQEAGYDDSNPKFETRAAEPEDFASDEESERPQVVVLQPGDLSAEQAAAEEDRLEQEAAEAKADLTKKIIFSSSKSKTKPEAERRDDRKRTSDSDNKNNKKSKQKVRPVLSFDVEEED